MPGELGMVVALDVPAPFKFKGNAPAGGAGIVCGFGGCCVEHPARRVTKIKVAQILRGDLNLGPATTAAGSKSFFFITDLPSN